jgi:hypothetical protein
LPIGQGIGVSVMAVMMTSPRTKQRTRWPMRNRGVQYAPIRRKRSASSIGRNLSAVHAIEPYLSCYTPLGQVYCAIRLSAAFVGFLFAEQRSGVTMVSADSWKEAW